MGRNSMLPRPYSRATSPNNARSSKTSATFPHQQFVPGDGIDVEILTTYIAVLGDNVDWRPAVNALNGKEGFLIKSAIPIRLDINVLRQQTSELRTNEQQRLNGQHNDKLHQGWAQHRQFLEHEADIQAGHSVQTQRIDLNLPVPFLDLPPSYNDVEGLHSGNRHSTLLAPTANTHLNVSRQRQRPVSCPPMNLFSPTGGYYSNGWNGPENQSFEAYGLATSRMTGPLGLPEFLPGTDFDNQIISPVTGPHGHTTLARARSTTSLRSQHWGLAHAPSQRRDAGDELFMGIPEPTTNGQYHQAAQRGGQYRTHLYPEGMPRWA